MDLSISTRGGWLSLTCAAKVNDVYSLMYFYIVGLPAAMIAIEQGRLSFAKKADAESGLAFLAASGVSESEMADVLSQHGYSHSENIAAAFSEDSAAIYDAIVASPWFCELEFAAEQIVEYGGQLIEVTPNHHRVRSRWWLID